MTGSGRWPFANAPIAASVGLAFPFEIRSNRGIKPRSRIFCGDFHTLPKKSAFFPPFLRFFLAFCDYLGYSRCGPSFFGEKQG
jgi:hypothetical protein